MKKVTNAAGVALVGLVALTLAIAAAPIAASLGLVALATIAGVVWMTTVHAALGGRREPRRVPVRVDAPRPRR